MKKVGSLIVLLILTFNVIVAMAGEEGKKVKKSESWSKFVQLFSTPLFFCRGECMDFRAGIDSEKGNVKESILARYDLHDDWDTFGQYSAGKTTKNPFQKKLPFYIGVEIIERRGNENWSVSHEYFEDLNFDGEVDSYYKYGEGSYRDAPRIPVKDLPADMQRRMQARFDGLLERLTKQMQKDLLEYLGIQIQQTKKK